MTSIISSKLQHFCDTEFISWENCSQISKSKSNSFSNCLSCISCEQCFVLSASHEQIDCVWWQILYLINDTKMKRKEIVSSISYFSRTMIYNIHEIVSIVFWFPIFIFQIDWINEYFFWTIQEIIFCFFLGVSMFW